VYGGRDLVCVRYPARAIESGLRALCGASS
jgi:hypothetical protein